MCGIILAQDDERNSLVSGDESGHTKFKLDEGENHSLSKEGG